MSKTATVKVKKTPEQRYSMKCDKIIGLLFQMKPIANTEEKKAFVYGTLETTLSHIKSLPTE